jgi:tetratricopeptide (TPR) repeat protein
MSMFALCMTMAVPAGAQLITMNAECREQIASGDALNAGAEYTQALELFDSIAEKCDTKDAAELVQTGRAKALNGLQRYPDATAAANIALEGTDQSSLPALAERAYAAEAQGDLAGARADYQRIIDLTEKNQNTAERAAVYAKVANLEYRAGNAGIANENLSKAMQLDPNNGDFDLQQADYAMVGGDYDGAMASLDKAVALGKADVDTYAMKSDVGLKRMQSKYGTDNAQQLRAKMTPQETAAVCGDLQKALGMGLMDMQKDMFAALVCK